MYDIQYRVGSTTMMEVAYARSPADAVALLLDWMDYEVSEILEVSG